jgi:hypothetical protein
MKVVCINNTNGNNVKLDLTIGNVYDVSTVNSLFYYNHYLYIDDKGKNCLVLKKWFISLSEYRRMKLKKINEKDL